MTRAQKVIRFSALFLALFFLFLRLYNIRDSFLFINDMGRDFLVLLQWKETGKPPLLGPLTSALPFNQSAWYFWSFFPAYLLTEGSPFSTFITNLALYLGTFLGGLYLVRHRLRWQRVWLLVFTGMTIHPQFIAQNRFVWNPSFVGPLLGLSILAYLRLRENFSWQMTFLHVFTLILAVSMNYSAAPALLAFGVIWLWQQRRHIFWLGGLSIVSGLTANIGTVFFELRHNFFLLKAVLRPEQVGQPNAPIWEKLQTLPFHLLATDSIWLSWLLILLLLIISFVYWRQKPVERVALSQDWSTLAILFGLTVLFTVLGPVAVQKHYLFAMLTTGFFFLAALPRQLALLLFIVLGSYWLRPQQLREHFARAPRTVQDLEQCFQTFCASHSQPFYVSVASDILPFHNGPEHRYFMRRYGCNVKDEYAEPGMARNMLVVEDNGVYHHGVTQFHELTLFGPSEERSVEYCGGNVRLHILEKNEYNTELHE